MVWLLNEMVKLILLWNEEDIVRKFPRKEALIILGINDN